MDQKQQTSLPPQLPPPPSKKKTGRGCLKLAIVFLCIFGAVGILSIVLGSNDEKEKEQEKKETASIQLTKEEWTKEVYEVLENDSELLDSIETQYKSYKELSILTGAILNLEDMVNKVIPDSLYMDVYDKPEFVKMMDNLSKRASKLLPEVLKHAREVYVKSIKSKLWEENIDVETRHGGTTITFIGGIFANNKNIKDWQTSASSTLKLFGFKRVEYKWIPSAYEYTYYDLTK